MICAANWKMNISFKQAQSFLTQFEKRVKKSEKQDFIFFAPALLAFIFEEKDLRWGGQNINSELRGAFTGENSVEIFKELGASFCLLGHSERRHLFNESYAEIRTKFCLMKDMGITPLLCVGEKEEEKGRKEDVLKEQLQDFKEEKNLLIAYEPVWSIGTGQTPSPEGINDTHHFIKDFLSPTSKVLYGGSVTSENAPAFAKQKNVDGFLVGGASLKPDDFYNIYDGVKKF